MLVPSKYKYEYKLYAGKQDTPTYSELLQLLRASLHAASRYVRLAAFAAVNR